MALAFIVKKKTLFFCYFREIIKIDYSDAPTNNEQIWTRGYAFDWK